MKLCECGCGKPTTIATITRNCDGVRKGQRNHFLRGHGKRSQKTLEERFWEKVDKSGSVPRHMRHLGICWNWTAGKMPFGYGTFAIGTPERKQNVRAHRYSYELSHGAVPKGLCVLHHCDNPACVRPSHLFVGTQSDNRSDCSKKGRNPSHKLTPDEVREIRLQRLNGSTQQAIAGRFQVSHIVIGHIVRGESYKWVA